jgi:hypothetical protein
MPLSCNALLTTQPILSPGWVRNERSLGLPADPDGFGRAADEDQGPSPRLNVRTETGQFRAITFVIKRNSGRYVRGLSLKQIADALAVACGPRGSMADYLHSTVSRLEGMG